MNELIKVEEGQLILVQEAINQLCEFENAKKQIEEAEKKIKARLEELMSKGECGTSYESPDKRLKITYTPESYTYRLNQDKLQHEQPDIFSQYYERTTRKGSIRITVREVKEK